MADENKGLTFDKSLFAVYISILFYLCAFGYKKGYFINYYVPASFVSFDFSSLLLISGPILGFLVSVVYMLNLLFRWFPRRNATAKKGFMFLGVGLPITLICLWFIGWEYWRWYLLIIVIFIGIELLLPHFLHKKTGLSYWERHSKIWSRESIVSIAPDRSDFEFWFIDRFGKHFYYAFWALYLFPLLFTAYGINTSAHEITHTIIESKPEMLVIDKRNNELICKSFNRQNKTFDSNFCVLKESEYSGLIIRNENIGILKYEVVIPK